MSYLSNRNQKERPNIFDYLTEELKKCYNEDLVDINFSHAIQQYVTIYNPDRLIIKLYSNITTKDEHYTNYEIVLVNNNKHLHSALLPCSNSVILEWIEMKEVHPILQEFINATNCPKLYHDEFIITEIIHELNHYSSKVNIEQSIMENNLYFLVKRTDNKKLIEFKKLYFQENKLNCSLSKVVEYFNPYYLKFLFMNNIPIDDSLAHIHRYTIMRYLMPIMKQFIDDYIHSNYCILSNINDNNVLFKFYEKMDNFKTLKKPSYFVQKKLNNNTKSLKNEYIPVYYHVYHKSDKQLKNNYYIKIVKNSKSTMYSMSEFYNNNFFDIIKRRIKPNIFLQGSLNYISSIMQTKLKIGKDSNYSILNVNCCHAHSLNLLMLQNKNVNNQLYLRSSSSRLLSEVFDVNDLKEFKGSYKLNKKSPIILSSSNSLPSLQLIYYNNSSHLHADTNKNYLYPNVDLRKRKNKQMNTDVI